LQFASKPPFLKKISGHGVSKVQKNFSENLEPLSFETKIFDHSHLKNKIL